MIRILEFTLMYTYPIYIQFNSIRKKNKNNNLFQCLFLIIDFYRFILVQFSTHTYYVTLYIPTWKISSMKEACIYIYLFILFAIVFIFNFHNL